MRIVYSAQALEEIIEIQEWWLELRDKNPDLFADELAAVERRILSGPHRPPVYDEIDGRVIRRMLLPGTRHQFYYQFKHDVVYVLSVWGAPRKGPPLLRPVGSVRQRRVVPSRGVSLRLLLRSLLGRASLATPKTIALLGA